MLGFTGEEESRMIGSSRVPPSEEWERLIGPAGIGSVEIEREDSESNTESPARNCCGSESSSNMSIMPLAAVVLVVLPATCFDVLTGRDTKNAY